MNTTQLAAKLLDDGFAAFIGDGLIIEIATAYVGRHRDYGGYEQINRKPWNPLAKPKAAKSIDHAKGEMKGAPGSQERIESYAKFYAPIADKIQALAQLGEGLDDSNCPSAFTLANDELADRLRLLGLDYIQEGDAVRAVKVEKLTTAKARRKKKLD